MKHICNCGNFKLVTESICSDCKEPKKDWVDEASEYLDKIHGRELETAAKPTRYNTGTLEVWDAIHQLKFDYFQGAIIKYIARYQHKNGPEDLVKSINYTVKMIANQTGQDYYELMKLTPEELAKRVAELKK